MRLKNFAVGLGTLTLAMMSAVSARAQATPTASQLFEISAFGGLTGNFTGLQGGKNLSITAGGDIRFRRYFGVNPAIEVRGTYPMDKGTISSQKNVLAGLKVEKQYGRFHPYGDFLFGRGAIDYAHAYPAAEGTLTYLRTTSNVLSPGVGVDIDLSQHLAFKADMQLQRYATPVTASGSVYSKAITFGAVYRFDFNHHKHERR